MNWTLAALRRFADEFCAEFDVSVGDMIRDTLLGTAACLIGFVNVILLVASVRS